MKNVPESISFNKLQENLKVVSITVDGYTFESGIPGIMFFPDGTSQYAEIQVSDIQNGDRWVVVLNPCVPFAEITKIPQ